MPQQINQRKIDPTVDCVFKAIFGAEENKNVCIHFINSMLELKGKDRIADIQIQNPYNEREFNYDKLSIVDIKVADQNDNRYQIEIQMQVYSELPSRILYTWSSIYHSTISKGDSYSQLKRVISIWILKDSIFPDIDDYYFDFCLYNRKHNIILTDDISIHILQLPKFKHKKELNDKEKWTYLLKEGSKMNPNPSSIPSLIDIPEIRQAVGVMQRFSERENEYLLYESRLDAEREMATWQNHIRRTEEALKKERQEKERLLSLLQKHRIAPY